MLIKRRQCPECKGWNTIKKGKIPTRAKGHRQRYLCNKCARTFY